MRRDTGGRVRLVTAHARDSHSTVPYDGAVTSTASSPDTRQGQTPHDQPPSWQQRLRRFGYTAGPRSDVRERLVPSYVQPSPRLWQVLGVPKALAERIARWSGWGGPLLVTLMAGVMRFWHLGSPKAVIFDETYYAKDAWALVHRGFEVNWDKDANDLILSTNGHVPIPTDAAYVVHPPVGKYVIGLGELLFGFDLRLAVHDGAARDAVGPDAVPYRAPYLPLDLPRLSGRRADGGGRPRLRDEPYLAARRRADVLRARGVRLSGHRP